MEERTEAMPDVKQVLLGYVADSLELMIQKPLRRDRIVHAVRVNMKRSRAVLRLIRPFLGEEIYRRENVAFRDTSRLLAQLRESKVYLKTLNKLHKRYKKFVPGSLMEETEKILSSHRGRVVQEDIHGDDVWEEVIDRLWKAKFRINFIAMNDIPNRAFYEGFEKVFMKGLDYHLDSLKFPAMENIHEFRKFAKYLWYQLLFFEHLEPEVFASASAALEDLTNRLGNEHDLHVLEAFLTENSGNLGRKRRINELIRVIRKEQKRQLKKSWPLARQVYHERPTVLELTRKVYA